MKTFTDFLLTEKFINSIAKSSEDAEAITIRSKWADAAWEILQNSYKEIGGIHGSGFNDIDDMIHNIPFWKLFISGGKLRAVVMYKDKGGRKLVALGSDGSPDGVKALAGIFNATFDKGFAELSGKALGFAIKSVGKDIIHQFAIKSDYVKELLRKDDVEPVTKDSLADLESDEIFMWNKFPFLHDRFYTREIGGNLHMKVLLGTPGVKLRK